MTRFLPLSLVALLACTPGTSPLYSGDATVDTDTPAGDDDSGLTETGTSADTGTDTGMSDTGSDEPVEYEDFDGDGQTGRIDCDDTDAAIHVGATETCNGIDDDCDGAIDEDEVCSTSDLDGDGYTPAGGDCDDTDAAINPGAEDNSLDGIDQDCNDVPVDTDTGDDTDSEPEPPTDVDGDGYTDAVDCNDADAAIYPGAIELEDGLDNDCDSVVDEGYDLDADGYSVAEGDCDDADAAIYPGASEVAYDGIDQDCSGSDLMDVDGDGYEYGDDCDDNDASVNARTDYWWDLDGDGYGGSYSGAACGNSGTLVVTNDDDCDDSDSAINPAASEYSAGLDDEDNDCDGSVDEDWQAYVEVEYTSTNYYVLNAGFYTSGATPNSLGWQETDTETSGTTTSVEFLTSEYGDMSGACGLIVNVNVGNPASSWLCQNWEVNSTVEIDAWFDGDWYDETDVDEWIANDSSGSCAAVIQVDTSSACTPVDDT